MRKKKRSAGVTMANPSFARWIQGDAFEGGLFAPGERAQPQQSRRAIYLRDSQRRRAKRSAKEIVRDNTSIRSSFMMLSAARTFALVAAMVLLYDLAVAVAVVEDSLASSSIGNRKLLFAPVTDAVGAVAGSGIQAQVGNLVMGALSPVLGACF